jgi:hypothetical protein
MTSISFIISPAEVGGRAKDKRVRIVNPNKKEDRNFMIICLIVSGLEESILLK